MLHGVAIRAFLSQSMFSRKKVSDVVPAQDRR
jgi:hypothetical protein